MRFMILIKADAASESGALPDEKILTEMGKYNEELIKAGVLLDGNGLHPSSRGARVRFSAGSRTVVDGPFSEAKDLVAGYWVIQVKSREEAIEWVKRCPLDGGAEVEVRQIFEVSDFANIPPEVAKLEESFRGSSSAPR